MTRRSRCSQPTPKPYTASSPGEAVGFSGEDAFPFAHGEHRYVRIANRTYGSNYLWAGSQIRRAHGCAPVPAPDIRPLPGGKRSGRVWGVPPNPHQRGLRPLWTLLPDGSFRPDSASGCNISATSHPPRILLDITAVTGSRTILRALGSTPPNQVTAAPKTSARQSSRPGHPPTSLAGSGADRGWGGTPQAPTREGCALSGLSRRAGSLCLVRPAMCSGSAASSP